MSLLPTEIPHLDDLPYHVEGAARYLELAAEKLRGLNLEFDDSGLRGVEDDDLNGVEEAEKERQAQSLWTKEVLPILEGLRWSTKK